MDHSFVLDQETDLLKESGLSKVMWLIRMKENQIQVSWFEIQYS